jgi:hypothetical protein
MVACDGGQTLRGKLFHTDGTDTEQPKRADYFNVKELPNLSGCGQIVFMENNLSPVSCA